MYLIDVENEVIEELKARMPWVAWKKQNRRGGITKPPINPHTGNLASISDPSSWGSYDQAHNRAIMDRCDGVDVVLTDLHGVTGIDIDNCMHNGIIIKPWVKQVLGLGETYAEVSPSGRGIRMFVRGRTDKAIVDGIEGIEIYGSKRFVTVTGAWIPETPLEIANAPDTLKILLQRVALSRSQTLVRGRQDTYLRQQKAREKTFFRHVNDVAIGNLSMWVPLLLPSARQTDNGYRVRSNDLDRDLQEDLSICELGIMDFGVADQGDVQNGRRTPIDLVIEYGNEVYLELKGGSFADRISEENNKGNSITAAMWLCQTLGIDAVQASDNDDEEELVLASFNSRYAVLPDGGRTQVFFFDDEVIGKQSRRVLKSLSFIDFERLYSNRFIKVKTCTEKIKYGVVEKNESEKTVSVARWWLQHRGRRQFTGIDFVPGKPKVFNGKLNLWQDFAVTPIMGEWPLMKQHLIEVVASNNKEHAEYLLNWCAFLVQKPDQIPEVAVVLKGAKGTGKGTLGNALMRFFGQHAIQLASVHHLVSNFNSHFRDACFVFADEAFWPGDKSADGTLKRLITEPTLFIEKKGKDGVTTTNRTHLMMASNEEWIIPATTGERRYFVLNVSDYKQQDQGWFGAINQELENGGLEAMLYDLLHRDISGFNPRQIPASDALLDQQEANMDPLSIWWREILEVGVVPRSNYARPEWSSSADLLSDAKVSSIKLSSWLNPKTLSSFLLKKGCKLYRKSNVRGYDFPDFLHARREWEKMYPGTVWEEPELADWQSEVNPFAEEISELIANSEN